MSAQELLTQLRAIGVEINASGDDRLVIDAPKGSITPELRAALGEHKAELLQILKTPAAPAQPAVTPPSISSAPIAVAPEVTAPRFDPPVVRDENELAAPGTEDEIRQLEAELMRLHAEEEARRAEVEAARMAAENALRVEQARWRQAEEEAARRRAEQEKQRIEEEAREQADEENRRHIAEQELARAEEELKRMRAMEESRRADVDKRKQEAAQAHAAELAALHGAEDEQVARRAEEERRYLESEARKRSQEEELRRQSELRFRAIEEEILRVHAREQARTRAAEEARLQIEEAERRRVEAESRRVAEAEARQRAEEEARLRAQIEAQMRAEVEAQRKAEAETRRLAEEEARRRAEEEAQRLAAEEARQRAEEDARRQAEAEIRRQAEDEARRHAEAEAVRLAEQQARARAEDEARQKAEDELRRRAEMEARIRAEVEAKMRAEDADRREAEDARLHLESERLRVEAAKVTEPPAFPFELEHEEIEQSSLPPVVAETPAKVTEIAEWFDVGLEPEPDRTEAAAQQIAQSDDHFAATAQLEDHDLPGLMELDGGEEFQPVSVPESPAPQSHTVSPEALGQIRSEKAGERAAAVASLARFGGEDAFRHINSAFDDQSAEVRSAAARALFDFQDDRAAAFTRALREAPPDRRRKIGGAIASSGLANEAIRNLTGESRDKTYDAFSLLFLMSKAGEVQPLMRAIEEHPNIEVRLAVVKLLALSGQPDILPAFRRMAVRGSLPPEVRSAVMEAIYQITSQSPADSPSLV
jgi:hypothetical protein